MRARVLEAQRPVDQRAHDAESCLHPVAQHLGGGRFDDQNVPPDRRLEGVGCAEGHHAAAVEDRDPLAPLCLLQVVRGQHDGDAVRVAQRAQLRQEVAPGGGVEPRARLVEEQDRGPGEETLGELDAAAESPREPIDEIPPALGDPEAVQEGVDAPGELGTAQAVEPTVMAEVLLDGEPAVDARMLEDDAQPAAHGVGRAAHVVAEDARDASVRGQEGREDPEERALAARGGRRARHARR